MWKCKHCNKDFEFTRTTDKAHHSRWCQDNPLRKKYVEQLLNTGRRPKSKRKKMSIEQRNLLSKKRKEYLKTHPHNWSNKVKSSPCEYLKNYLKSLNISYIEEYQPLLDSGRYFAIDIAFPDKKIGIEVNGNQHYLDVSNGTLSPYYQERHNLICKDGWQLIELPYNLVYNKLLIDNIITDIQSKIPNIKFNYFGYVKRKKIYTCSCGNEKCKLSKTCSICSNKVGIKKVKWPNKEELEKLVWEIPTTQVAKKFGVSDVAVSKWCKKYEISKPPRGYWRKIKLHH